MDNIQRTLASFFVFSTFLLPSGAFAQSNDPKPPETARFGNPGGTVRNLQDLFYGVIKSVDKKEMVLEKTKFGVDQTIMLTEKTRYVRDEKPGKPEDLKVGDQVWIRIKKNKKSDDLTAELVLSGVIAPTIRK